MNELKTFISIFFFFLVFVLPAYSQNQDYKNLGFEQGNFNNWVGHHWIYSTARDVSSTIKTRGILNRRHTIMTDTSAFDAKTGFALKKIPPGYRYSARLGDEILDWERSPRCWQQSLQYTMTIDSSNALLIIKFACVLEYESNHPMLVEPRFRFTLYDENGDTIPDCSNYDVYATNTEVEGFNTFWPEGADDPIRWRDWTTVGANLINYYGRTITLEFLATDCTGHFHFGYSYIVVDCQPLNISVKFCENDSTASLTAPQGFVSYNWTNNNGDVVGTTQTYDVINPTEGETYTCTMHSATGCSVSLNSKIAKYKPRAEFASEMVDCNSNTVKFTNLSTTTNGILQYYWDFGDTISYEKDPLHTFPTSGLHPVSLMVLNPPSICINRMDKVVESFSPPLVGITGESTYCPGESVFLRAYGAYDYTWNTNSKEDSIEIRDPGGDFWLLGRSSTGCISDTIRRLVSEQPYWEFLSYSDTTLCEDSTTILSVSGADNYLWSTGETSNSITVSVPGNYSVTGRDARGCKKDLAFYITEYPLPKVDFVLSPYTLDDKRRELNGFIEPEKNVVYTWDMDDGTTESGSQFRHTYSRSHDALFYTITLFAESEHNCLKSSSDIIDVIPFVPNVFTPNFDGINDVFMSGFDLKVYDRNGMLLYAGNEGWNGTLNGTDLEPDTYFYIIEYKNRMSESKNLKGYFTLIR